MRSLAQAPEMEVGAETAGMDPAKQFTLNLVHFRALISHLSLFRAEPFLVQPLLSSFIRFQYSIANLISPPFPIITLLSFSMQPLFASLYVCFLMTADVPYRS